MRRRRNGRAQGGSCCSAGSEAGAVSAGWRVVWACSRWPLLHSTDVTAPSPRTHVPSAVHPAMRLPARWPLATSFARNLHASCKRNSDGARPRRPCASIMAPLVPSLAGPHERFGSEQSPGRAGGCAAAASASTPLLRPLLHCCLGRLAVAGRRASRLVSWRRHGSHKPQKSPAAGRYARRPSSSGGIQLVACASDWASRQPCGT